MAAPLTCHVSSVSLPAEVTAFQATNMACALKAELKCKDGAVTKFTVEAERNFKSLIDGVKKINSEISVVLTALVEEERSARADRGESRAHDEEEEEDDDNEEDDGDEEEDGAEVKKLKPGPPSKRLKTITPS